MQTFDFFHKVGPVEYPAGSAKIRFGDGYEFASKPRGKDQLIFTLKFENMFYYIDVGNEVSRWHRYQTNMLMLTAFYEAHKMYEKFQYFHHIHGLQTCRFYQPLVVPEGVPNAVSMSSTVSLAYAAAWVGTANAPGSYYLPYELMNAPLRAHLRAPFEMKFITQP
jgi:hypothetical protein